MRMQDVPPELAALPCPDMGPTPEVTPPPAAARRVAIVSTAGLMQRGDQAFEFGAADYRVIDGDSDADLLMSHVSANFDRTGFLQDHEVVFPLAGLRRMAGEGRIAGVARYHFSFMGATDPRAMAPAARELARAMRAEGTNVALLIPV